MSWVTLDDAAPLHRKQVAAGALACWLWTCGLAYCDRQDAKDGFIPDAVVQVLYPGLGKKEARKLVEVGLWEPVAGGYAVHDYHYWREKRFAGTKVTRGSAGGSVSSERKRQAALEREAKKRLARQNGTTGEHDEQTTTTTTPVTKTTSPTDGVGSGAESGSGSDSEEPSNAGAREEPPGDPAEPTAAEVLQAKAEWCLEDPFGKGLEYGPPEMWPEVRADFEDFCSVWPGSGKLRSRDSRATVILRRYAEGTTSEQLRKAARGAKNDAHIAGNPGYQTVQTIWRDAGQIDRFCKLADSPPAPAKGHRQQAGTGFNASEYVR